MFVLWSFPIMLFSQQPVNIIPQPVEMKINTGYFIIEKNTPVIFNKTNAELTHAASFLKSHIKNISGYILPENIHGKNSIQLIIKKTEGIGTEGYLLTVSPISVDITANTKAGIIYGIQSLFQTLPAIRTNAALRVPCMTIKDYPRFKWRGMHLDVSRHFFRLIL